MPYPKPTYFVLGGGQQRFWSLQWGYIPVSPWDPKLQSHLMLLASLRWLTFIVSLTGLGVPWETRLCCFQKGFMEAARPTLNANMTHVSGWMQRSIQLSVYEHLSLLLAVDGLPHVPLPGLPCCGGLDLLKPGVKTSPSLLQKLLPAILLQQQK